MRSRSTTPLPAIVLGRDITALGVIRTLGRRGVAAFTADEPDGIVARSRFYRPTPIQLAETDDSAALAAFLEQLPVARAVVIATTDRWMAAVAGLPPEARIRFRASAPPRDSVERCIDAEQFRAFVQELGMPSGGRDGAAGLLIDGFVDRSGRVRAMVARRRIRGGTVTIPVAEAGDAVEMTHSLLEALDYRGIFTIGFEQDDLDDRCAVIDLSPRATTSIEGLAHAGADLAWMAYRDAQDRTVPAVTRYAVGRRVRDHVGDVAPLVSIDDPMPGVFQVIRAIGLASGGVPDRPVPSPGRLRRAS